eukprot:CAMPEP_0185732896 /NCGR_PEP_ID=MMETSP1171-20130828/17863_1 /TAXON_ID=374046 /ORGANISM="Helicotheca tamensis, Strain CCMP826" /LENGTH=318 /DNA_ID=CAMNT_0028402499 /DNA_START=138 /DNA_END=1094 /DNA_ORIENTATION=+
MASGRTAEEDYGTNHDGGGDNSDSENDNDYSSSTLGEGSPSRSGAELWGKVRESVNDKKHNHLLSLDNAPDPDTSWTRESYRGDEEEGAPGSPPKEDPPDVPTTPDSPEKAPWEENSNYQNGRSPRKKKSRGINNSSNNKPPRKPFCLSLFTVLSIIAVLSNLLFLACQIIPLFYLHYNTEDDLETIILQYVLRIYLAILTLYFILGECEVPLAFIQHSQSLQNWMSRGFLYTFLAMLGMQQSSSSSSAAESENGANEDVVTSSWLMQELKLPIMISEWMLFGVGVLYMLLGICCMKRVKDRLRNAHREEWEEYNDYA